ncbi:MAG TPA: hypothetical protein VGA04_19310 [Streptosporangiaceae bacterium]
MSQSGARRPGLLLADRGYAHDSTRAMLRRRGVRHDIPERRDRDGSYEEDGRGPRNGRSDAVFVALGLALRWP